MILELVFAHILYSSLIASLMILLLLIIKKLLPDLLAARFVHLVWILILVRLLMPINIENPFNDLKLIPDKVPLISYQGVTEMAANQADAAQPLKFKTNETNSVKNFNDSYLNLDLLSRLWLIGLIIFLIFSAFIAVRFKLQIAKYTELTDSEIISLIEQVSNRLNIKRRIPVYMHESVKSPYLSGILKPCIYLPLDINNRIHAHQFEHVIMHELAHYKRKDLLYNAGFVLAALLHWFNPLVWLAVREMRIDREVASDAFVLNVLGESGVIPYGMTIIKLAGSFSKRSPQFNLVAFNETHSQVERRVKMIKKYKKGSYKLSTWAVLLVIVMGVFTLTTFSSAKLDAKESLNKSIQGQLVLIDPGHGGADPGAVYPANPADPESQLKEKDLNLDIALKLKAMLEKSGLKVAMSRQDDTYRPLEDMAKWSKQNAALLVSIHNNSSMKTNTNGTMTYSQPIQNNTSFSNSQLAAQMIQNRLVKDLGTTNLGNKSAKFRILNEAAMPAVMTDIAFISNESDREKLKSEEFRLKAAQALHDGIIEALNEMQSAQKRK